MINMSYTKRITNGILLTVTTYIIKVVCILQATTVFYPAPTTEPVEPINLWIVVGGSVGGIVLLVILFAVMWKVRLVY